MKQPEVLVEAVRRARAKGRDMHLLIMGNGADDPRSDLTRTLHASLPADRFTTIGHQENVAHWMPAIDIFALSSGWGEGFPNVIGKSEEHTSELQSLMRISYAVFCLKKKKHISRTKSTQTPQ